MMFKHQKASAAMVFLAFVLALTLSASASPETLTIAVPTDPDSFDPTQAVAAATWEIAFNVYEGLVTTLPSGELTGGLASHWEIDDTGTVYTFYLREAYFHSGEQVTPEDVVHVLDRIRDPEISEARAGEFSVIESVEAGADSVIVTLKRPHGPFLFTLAGMPGAVYPQDVENLSSRPIGTGPYRLTEWRPNQHIRLERFEEHWSDSQPFFETVEFRIMPDESSAVLNLKTGHVDVIPRLEAALLHQVENEPQLTVHRAPMNLVQILAINHQREPFDNRLVRQALAHAVDKDEIIYGAAWGEGEPLVTGLSPAMAVFHNDEITGYAYDPDRARQLLAEADVGDLSVTLELPAPYALHVQAGEIAAEQLEAVGFDVTLQIVEWGTWLERIYSQRDYDMTIVGLAGRLDPHEVLVRYESSSSRNFFNFSNAEYDELIAEGQTAEHEERIPIYHRAQEILTEEVAGLFLMDPSQLAVMQSSIQGWESYPIYVVDAARLYR